MLTGQNGIFNRAQEAKEKTETAQEDENKRLQGYEDIINSYTNNLPTGEGTTPYLPNSTFSYKEGELSTGLVIEDSDNNEYVWVEVPTTIYENINYNGNGANKPSSSKDYSNIEACLKTYTSNYSDSSYSDTNTSFEELYQNMLKSVYENGGFWIGRYEAGIEAEKNPRTEYTEIADSDKAVIKPNMIPYNYVTRDDAQELATRMNYTNCTSSLIFGIQWDLVLKYIEVKNISKDSEIISKLTSNSGMLIGNYYNSELTLNRGKFAQNNELTNWYDFKSEDKTDLVTGGKKKAQNSDSNSILITTGGAKETNLQNIYDIAGNLWEWTLEFYETNSPCVFRGGSYVLDSGFCANYRYRSGTDYSFNDIGIRIGLWK